MQFSYVNLFLLVVLLCVFSLILKKKRTKGFILTFELLLFLPLLILIPLGFSQLQQNKSQNKYVKQLYIEIYKMQFQNLLKDSENNGNALIMYRLKQNIQRNNPDWNVAIHNSTIEIETKEIGNITIDCNNNNESN